MLRIAVTPSSFAEADPAPMELLRSAPGVEVVPNPRGRRLSEDEALALLGSGIDGLVAGLEPLTRRVLAAAAPRLKAIARVGIGLDNVDLRAAAELGIAVSNTPEGPTAAVAELTLAAMLALSRRLLEMNAALHGKAWEKRISPGLGGSTVLVVGYGRIGRRVGQLLRPFGVRLLVADPHLAADPEPDARLVALGDGLAQADIVTLHASGTATILDRAAFGRLRRGALLLNAARGELVDEDALLEALDAGILAGCWSDAFRQEPYAGPLCGHPRALLTPHAGTYTERCRLDMELAAVRNVLRDLGLA